MRTSVRACVRVRISGIMRAYERACMRASVRACVRVRISVPYNATSPILLLGGMIFRQVVTAACAMTVRQVRLPTLVIICVFLPA